MRERMYVCVCVCVCVCSPHSAPVSYSPTLNTHTCFSFFVIPRWNRTTNFTQADADLEPELKDRMKEFADWRKTWVTYTPEMQKVHHIHIKAWPAEYRILEHFYGGCV